MVATQIRISLAKLANICKHVHARNNKVCFMFRQPLKVSNKKYLQVEKNSPFIVDGNTFRILR